MPRKIGGDWEVIYIIFSRQTGKLKLGLLCWLSLVSFTCLGERKEVLVWGGGIQIQF
jgi:hypothetical protein